MPATAPSPDGATSYRFSRTRLTCVGCSNSSRRTSATSVHGPRLLVHVVHQDEVAEGVGGGEVGLAPAHLADLLHEGHQLVVTGQHEGVDHDALAAAVGDLLQGQGY